MVKLNATYCSCSGHFKVQGFPSLVTGHFTYSRKLMNDKTKILTEHKHWRLKDRILGASKACLGINKIGFLVSCFAGALVLYGLSAERPNV